MFRHDPTPPPGQSAQPAQPHQRRRGAPDERGGGSAPPSAATPGAADGRGTLSFWQFVRQRLEHFVVPWDDGADHFDRLLDELHCTWQYRLGARHEGFWVEVYRNERPAPGLAFEYLLTLNGRTASDIVLVGDLPDLLYMLEHLSPIVQASMRSGERGARPRPLVVAREGGAAGRPQATT